MKTLRYILIGVIILTSCKTEPIEIFDLRVSPDEVTRIELTGDHKTLLPNGIARMEFQTHVYAKRTATHYSDKDDNGKNNTVEIESEFLVAEDQLPEDFVKLYTSAGTQLPDFGYSTTTDAPGTQVEFYAKAGNIESNRLIITIRELPDESYNEIVVPVVFHLLQPPTTKVPEYKISVEFLEKQLQMVNDAFNRTRTTDPNGGTAKVVFKLALYSPSGRLLDQPGLNINNITAADYEDIGTSSNKRAPYLAYILKRKSSILWDPSKYLNIWLANFRSSTNVTGIGYSYYTLPPQQIHSDFGVPSAANPAVDNTSLPGFKLAINDDFSAGDLTDPCRAGVMVNIRGFIVPSTIQGARNEFSLATAIAEHYGILQTRCDSYRDLNEDGDNDYCPDTYNYEYAWYASIYKGNNLYRQPENDPTRPMEYFTSYNVMDIYSRKTSISVDQAKRIRTAIEYCPDRWCYKSDWAFTGNN